MDEDTVATLVIGEGVYKYVKPVTGSLWRITQMMTS